MHTNIRITAVSLLALSAAGCNDASDPARAEVTYWQDVAPIFFESCVTCHQQDSIAPFRLDSYAEAKEWSVAAREAVEERTMPPWLVTSDGSCGDFRDARWLDDDEIATIAAWVEAGAPEGTPRDDLQVPPSSAPGQALDDGSGEIMVVASPDYVPAPAGGPLDTYDDYRCFLLDTELDRDRFITGFEVIPGNEAMVHHMAVMVVNPDLEVGMGKTNMDVMRAMDEESPDRLGWPCYSQAGEEVRIDSQPVTWAPGMGPVPYPDKSGMRLPAGRVLVVQLHYNLIDESVRGQSDSTLVRLRVADEVEREGVYTGGDRLLFSGDTLAPGQASLPYTWETELADVLAPFEVERARLYGVFPHMHELGRRFRVELVDGASDAHCAAQVESWDFHWQLLYFYDQPLEITQDQRLRVTCEYDTSDRTEPTLPGWGTQNEMCFVGLYLVLP
jgi:mono/diheme cytochrome c family protein